MLFVLAMKTTLKQTRKIRKTRIRRKQRQKTRRTNKHRVYVGSE